MQSLNFMSIFCVWTSVILFVWMWNMPGRKPFWICSSALRGFVLCKSYGFLKLKCNQENKFSVLRQIYSDNWMQERYWSWDFEHVVCKLIWELSFRGKLHWMMHCRNLTQGMRKVTYIVEIFLRNVTLSRTSIHKIQFWTIFFFCIISLVLEWQMNSSC